MELKSGSQLQNGKYILERKIGEGGFSITYKGIWKIEVPNPLGKTIVDYQVAIKEFFFSEYCSRNEKTGEIIVNSEKGQEVFLRFKEKLKQEARILLEVEHPNIVNVSEVFEENNTAYMVMEFIDGENLKDIICKNEFLNLNDVLFHIKQIGNALQYIHERNIIHLDVKPANILIDKTGNARLIDFGIAKQYTDTNPQTQAATVTAFSKGYSPIEQYAANRKEKYGAYTDIYSLGATLYHCVTREVPIEAASRLSEELIPPSRYNPALPMHIERAILKAMELKHKDRFATVMDFLEALEQENISDTISINQSVKDKIQNSDFVEYDTKFIHESIENKTPSSSNFDKKTLVAEEETVIHSNSKSRGKTKKSPKTKTPVSETDNQNSENGDTKTTSKFKIKNAKLAVIATVAMAIAVIVATCIYFIPAFGKNESKKTEQTPTIEYKTETEKAIAPIETEPEKEVLQTIDTIKLPEKKSPKPQKMTLYIKGNKYEGYVKDGKPNGIGTIYYSREGKVFINNARTILSKPGDYLEGRWNKGELEFGTLYDKNGNKKETFIIGSF
jgi:serine/threonine protein kinase